MPSHHVMDGLGTPPRMLFATAPAAVPRRSNVMPFRCCSDRDEARRAGPGKGAALRQPEQQGRDDRRASVLLGTVPHTSLPPPAL